MLLLNHLRLYRRGQTIKLSPQTPIFLKQTMKCMVKTSLTTCKAKTSLTTTTTRSLQITRAPSTTKAVRSSRSSLQNPQIVTTPTTSYVRTLSRATRRCLLPYYNLLSTTIQSLFTRLIMMGNPANCCSIRRWSRIRESTQLLILTLKMILMIKTTTVSLRAIRLVRTNIHLNLIPLDRTITTKQSKNSDVFVRFAYSKGWHEFWFRKNLRSPIPTRTSWSKVQANPSTSQKFQNHSFHYKKTSNHCKGSSKT